MFRAAKRPYDLPSNSNYPVHGNRQASIPYDDLKGKSYEHWNRKILRHHPRLWLHRSR
ncbi:protein of unknown function [Nitratireductor aquimarinus]